VKECAAGELEALARKKRFASVSHSMEIYSVVSPAKKSREKWFSFAPLTNTILVTKTEM
jgi:hypothetical protein